MNSKLTLKLMKILKNNQRISKEEFYFRFKKI